MSFRFEFILQGRECRISPGITYEILDSLSIFESRPWIAKVGHLELLTHISFQKQCLFWVVTLPSWTLAVRTIAILFSSPSSPFLHLSLSQGRYFLREHGPLSQTRKVRFQRYVSPGALAFKSVSTYVVFSARYPNPPHLSWRLSLWHAEYVCLLQNCGQDANREGEREKKGREREQEGGREEGGWEMWIRVHSCW